MRVLIRREVLSLWRQRRLLLMILVIPAVTAPLVMILPGLMTRAQENRVRDRSFSVAVQDEADSGIATALRGDGFKVVLNRDARRVVLLRRVDVGVVVSPNVSPNIVGSSLRVEILLISARPGSRLAAGTVLVSLQQIDKERARTQLAARGLPPELAEGIAASVTDVGAAESNAQHQAASSLPGFLILQLLFLVSISAGLIQEEKERRTLETLLVLPFRRRDLVVAKWVAATSLGLFALAAFTTFVVGLGALPVGLIGESLRLSAADVALVGFAGALLVGVFAGAGTLIGARARTPAQANAYTGVVTLPLVAAGIALQFVLDGDSVGVLALVPGLGMGVVIREGLQGTLEMWAGLMSVGLHIALGGGLLWLAAGGLDRSEAVLRTQA
ncbi:MAG: ABC transporter permease subunit [Actinomycetota bacterium]